MNLKQMIIPKISVNLQKILQKIPEKDFNEIQEIRMRVNKPIILMVEEKEKYLSARYGISDDGVDGVILTKNDIDNSLELISNYSLYALEEEIKNGFITIEGGHRVGLVGKVINENGRIKSIRNISSLNFRISHEVIGCSNKVLPYIIKDKVVQHTLIVSPPKCGKTTLLRDIVRQISNGNKYIGRGLSVGVVDERSEIGGCYKGVPQNDVGIRTDILDCCPKTEGMLMLLRSMSPDVIVVDEIGSKDDLDAIEYVLNAGIKIICTVHGKNYKDLLNKPVLSQMLKNSYFERIVILNNKYSTGNIDSILDANGNEQLKSYRSQV